ncbi:uncharacterized protein FOMMEDRAFT_29216 [Fomitiporia mediterranea MF3/22]|uniref:uncharacterized protein n=1 Tax=Fomitiporia mediterranea (strain MF3/22) TaxID=694068 RepID=UPI000440839F|nr:uncharacterized protein FOMMEDRAFT_29216 [Fomitiporia mediterranea MF3/22]EJD02125.1 hypothetical protein FOMMEDRAFT_29216 [Fomitiporia mediterranea MF3/22]
MPKVTTQRVLGPFVCSVPECGKTFIRQHDLTRHARASITRTPNNLKTHFIGRHVNPKAYACRFNDCGRTYTDDSSLIKHEKKCHKFYRRAQKPYVRPPTPTLRLQVHASMFVQGTSKSQEPSPTTSSGDEQFNFEQYLDEILGLCKPSEASSTGHASSGFSESQRHRHLDNERSEATSAQKVNALNASVSTCQDPLLDQVSELFSVQVPFPWQQGLGEVDLGVETWNTFLIE